jgi:hypothetical protein
MMSQAADRGGHFENLNHEQYIVYFWILGYGDGTVEDGAARG